MTTTTTKAQRPTEQEIARLLREGAGIAFALTAGWEKSDFYRPLAAEMKAAADALESSASDMTFAQKVAGAAELLRTKAYEQPGALVVDLSTRERKGTPPGSMRIYEGIGAASKALHGYLEANSLTQDERGEAVAVAFFQCSREVLDFIEGEYALRAGVTEGS